MVKKMKLIPSLFKITDTNSTWPWPSCRQPRTLSFRTTSAAVAAAVTESSDSYFTISSSDTGSFSTVSDSSREDSIERMIRGLRSAERLSFDPTGKTRSIIEKDDDDDNEMSFPFKESTTIMSMDSEDPYMDFRKSMEEMVEAHRIKDWENLEELLSWYLRINRKSHHEYIHGAFVDLLVNLALASSSSSSQIYSPLSLCSYSYYSSSFCSSSSSSIQIEEISSSFEEN